MTSEGWSLANIHHATQRKSHYVRDGSPICGAYIRDPGPLEKDRPTTVDDCLRCRRKLKRRWRGDLS